MTIAAGIAFGYAGVLFYAAMARLWASLSRVKSSPVELPARPPLLIELPSHPHSNLGWWQSTGRVHVSCAAADPDATRKLNPNVSLGIYLCRDCEAELQKNGLGHGEWARRHNAIVKASQPERQRTPWLWPIWILLRPIEKMAPTEGHP